MRIRIVIRAETLLVLLHKRGWSQGQLATALNVTDSYVSQIIQGKVGVSADVSTRLLDTFRGMSHKPGGRLKWDDLFKPETVGSGASS